VGRGLVLMGLVRPRVGLKWQNGQPSLLGSERE